MKLHVTKSGNSCYFSAKLGWKEQFDPKEIELLTAGAVSMLIAPETVQGRKNNIIRYDISPYTTLAFYLTCILNREQFVELLEQFVALFQRLRTVYLNPQNLVLDFDKVFVRLNDRSLHLIYLPVLNSKREVPIPDFFRRLTQTVGRSTYEQVVFVGALTAFLDRPGPFMLGELETFLKGSGNAAPAEEPAPVWATVRPERSAVYTPPAQDAAPTGYGGTVLLSEQGGTVLLAEEPECPKPVLVRSRTGDKIPVNRPVFRIGKEAGQVDYCITDNPAVSRSHAQILFRDGGYFVEDLQSTNKTYLNGCAVIPGEKCPLEDGARMRLGNEEFVFELKG